MIFIKRSRTGVHIRAVGENPNAAESVGISVSKTYFLTWAISGLLGGIGGVFMSMGYTSAFTKNMVAGRGYIGLCASSMVRGNPIGAMLCAMVFGVSDAIANQLTNAPVDLVMMLPYAVTIIVLIIISVIKIRTHVRKIKNKASQVV